MFDTPRFKSLEWAFELILLLSKEALNWWRTTLMLRIIISVWNDGFYPAITCAKQRSLRDASSLQNDSSFGTTETFITRVLFELVLLLNEVWKWWYNVFFSWNIENTFPQAQFRLSNGKRFLWKLCVWKLKKAKNVSCFEKQMHFRTKHQVHPQMWRERWTHKVQIR